MSLPYFTGSNVGYGSPLITPTSGNANGISFIANEFDPVLPTAQTTRTTELGAPNGWIGFRERYTGRGQLQSATNITGIPAPGDEFVFPVPTTNSNSTNVTFVFTEIGLPRRPREFWAIDFQAMEKA